MILALEVGHLDFEIVLDAARIFVDYAARPRGRASVPIRYASERSRRLLAALVAGREDDLFSRCVITSGCAGGAAQGAWNLFTVPAKGGPAIQFVQITDVSATRSNWLWNPKVGMPIAFTGVKSGPSGEGGVYLVGPDGTNPTRIPTDASIPTATRLGFQTGRR